MAFRSDRGGWAFLSEGAIIEKRKAKKKVWLAGGLKGEQSLEFVFGHFEKEESVESCMSKVGLDILF